MEETTMSSKSCIPALAKALVEKDGLKQADAENFVKAMFEVANDGLQTGKLVKVRWLGSFKVLAVKDRESVDVNTGERIVIEGRDKISFTPDNILKELVNKPFAQFETVTLNDDTDFTEIDNKFSANLSPSELGDVRDSQEEPQVVKGIFFNEDVAPDEKNVSDGEEEFIPVIPDLITLIEEKTKSEATSQDEPLHEDNPLYEEDEPIEKEETLQEEKTLKEDISSDELAKVELLLDETPKEEESSVSPDSPDSPVEEEPVDLRTHMVLPRYMVIAACSLIVVLVLGIGWFAFIYGKMSAQRDYLAHQSEYLASELESIKKQPAPVDTTDSTVVEDSTQLELQRKAQEDSARMAKVSEAAMNPDNLESEDEKKSAAKTETKSSDKVDKKVKDKNKIKDKTEDKKTKESKTSEPTTTPIDKYDSDVRVKTGAYRIVGVAQTVKARSGQSMSSISRTYLGAGMECYMEALNGTSKVTAGQEVKIPKLELKKKGKK